MAEKLFWEVLTHLNEISPNFRIQGRRYCALPRRFKRFAFIHVSRFYYKFVLRKSVLRLTKRQVHANFTLHLHFLYVGF